MNYGDCFELPKGSIAKLMDRDLTWNDGPAELVEDSDKTRGYDDNRNCSTCKHWNKIKMGSESQIFGECALGETNTLSHLNITFENFHCSKQKRKKET